MGERGGGWECVSADAVFSRLSRKLCVWCAVPSSPSLTGSGGKTRWGSLVLASP